MLRSKAAGLYHSLFDAAVTQDASMLWRAVGRALRGGSYCADIALDKMSATTVRTVTVNGEEAIEYIHHIENHPWGDSADAVLNLFKDGSYTYTMDLLPTHRRLLRGVKAKHLRGIFNQAVGALLPTLSPCSGITLSEEADTVTYSYHRELINSFSHDVSITAELVRQVRAVMACSLKEGTQQWYLPEARNALMPPSFTIESHSQDMAVIKISYAATCDVFNHPVSTNSGVVAAQKLSESKSVFVYDYDKETDKLNIIVPKNMLPGYHQ